MLTKEKKLRIFSIFGVVIGISSMVYLIYLNLHYPQSLNLILNIFSCLYIGLFFIASGGLFFLKRWGNFLFISLFSIKLIETILRLIKYLIKSSSQIKGIHILEQTTMMIFFLLIIIFLYRNQPNCSRPN